MFKLFRSFAAFVLLMPLIVVPSHAEGPLQISLNHAKVFRISQPAGTVIVGDPRILAATIDDLQTLVLSGKAYGSTNLIVLDQDGQPLLDEVVVVQTNEDATVQIITPDGPKRMACSTICEPINDES